MFFRKKYNLKKLSDEDLVLHFRKEQDPDFVGELFERYTELAFLVSMKYMKDEEEAKDVVMQVFERVLTDLARYEVRSFKFWLHTVVKNQCLANLDKQQRSREKNEAFFEEEGGIMESPDESTLLDEPTQREIELKQLESALELLKAEQRTCVELFYLKHKSYKEIADLTGFSMMQVKSYIQNGKRNLKILMEKNEPMG